MTKINRTFDGWEITHDGERVVISDTWPPRNERVVDEILDNLPRSEAIKILHGVFEVKDLRRDE